MRKLFQFILLSLSCLLINNATAQSINWVKQLSKYHSQTALRMSADKAGNIYAFFNAEDSTGFDKAVVYPGGTSILKFRPDGSSVWFKYLGNSISAFVLDSNHNCFYISGSFKKKIKFDNGDSLTDPGSNVFLLKSDTSGKIVWVKKFGEIGSYGGVSVGALAVDSGGNLYATGRFAGTISLDSKHSIADSPKFKVFITKYTPDGRLLRAVTDGGYNNPSRFGTGVYPMYMLVDARNNLVMSGYAYIDKDTMAGTVLAVKYDESMFIAKYDSALHGIWAKQALHASNHSYVGFDMKCLVSDKNCNYYYAGTVSGDNVTWDNINYNSTSFRSNGYIVKYSTSGTVQWVDQVGDYMQMGAEDHDVGSISIDPDSNIYATGSVGQDFKIFGNNKTGLRILNLPGNIYSNFYVAKFNAKGVPLWMYTDSASAEGGCILYNKSNLFFSGAYSTTIRLKPYRLQNDPNKWNTFIGSMSARTVPGRWMSMQNFSGTFCAGSTIKVHYDTSSALVLDNAGPYILQLSDASGSFDHPVIIGTTSATHPSTDITGTIPRTLHSGSGYRVRVALVSYDIMSNDNGSDLVVYGRQINAKKHNTICYGDSIVLSADSAQYYKWNTGATTRSITVKKPGSYYYSNGSCASIDTVTVAVLHENVYLGHDTAILQGDTLTLNAQKHKTYKWSTGDSTQKIKITQSGIYHVFVTDSIGCTASDTIMVSVKVRTHVLKDDTSGVCRNSLQAYSVTDYTDNIYKWKVTGGKLVSGQGLSKVSVQWTVAGTGFLTLTEINKDKDSATSLARIKVLPLSGASFAVSDTCFGYPVTFKNNSGAAASQFWDFGDGTKGTGREPGHRYSYPGNYKVTLINLTAGGCMDTAVRSLTIHGLPDPSFSFIADTTGNVSFSANVNSYSSYYWQFGDSGTSSGAKTSHLYDTSGLYHVKLDVADPFGCTAAKDTFIRIYKSGLYENGHAIKDINFYPDPFSEVLHISFGIGNTSDLTVLVYDSKGAIVNQRKLLHCPAGPVSIALSAADFGNATGTFVIKILSAGGSITRKVERY